METAEINEAPATEQPQPALQPVLPVCPHCGADPVKLTLMFQPFPGGQIASLVFCGDCRKLLPAQIVAMANEQQSRIVKPRPRVI